MKARTSFKRRLMALMLVTAFIAPMLMAFAPMAETEVDPDFLAVITKFLTMGGFAALVAILINVLKALKVVKDGTAGTWSAGLNLLGLVGMYIYQVVTPGADITLIDQHLGAIAQIMSGIFSYVYTYWVSNTTHKVLSAGEVPLIGTSNTPKPVEEEPF